MARVLIIAEHDGDRLNVSTGKCVSCAAALDPQSIDVLVLAAQSAPIAAEAARLRGVSRVICRERPENASPVAAVLAPQIAALAPAYTHLLGPSTTFGKDLMPRVAALLGVGQLSDIMAVESPYRFKRPIYAGNAIITVEAPSEEILIGTVRTASWPSAPEADDSAPIDVDTDASELPSHTRFVGLKAASSDRPDLQTASRVVSGGRAIGSADNFKLVYELADRLGAAVGASRAAVDSGFVPNDMQVGQTGKIIAPELYVALGISGAIQHLTGIKDAQTIVAINKDSEAPIFEVADIGLVADLFEAVPELLEALDKQDS